jgi:lamin tail-like protein/flagellar hook capping protein FlgD
MSMSFFAASAVRSGVTIAAVVWAGLAAASSDVVISQVYPSGGYAGATYKHDYIELFNRGKFPVDVTGWAVHRRTGTIPEYRKVVDLSGTIQPGRYFLIQLVGSSPGGGAELPAPDATSLVRLEPSSGSVVLSISPNQFFCADAPDVAVDRVGYNSSFDCPEGTQLALGANLAGLRGFDGCLDTDNNLADFSAGAPTPRNSSSPPRGCEGVDVPRLRSQTGAFLGAASPNPFATSTELTFALGADGQVTIAVFDLRGGKVRTLIDGWRPAGPGRAMWDGVRDDGTAAPAGVYIVRLAAPAEGVQSARRFVRVP